MRLEVSIWPRFAEIRLMDCKDAETLIDEVITTLKLPKWAEDLASKYIIRVRSLIDFSR